MMAERVQSPAESLSALFDGFVELTPAQERTVYGLASDSRNTQQGEVFFALAGAEVDGARYCDDAVAAGATAVVTAGAPGARVTDRGVVYLQVPDVAQCLGAVSHRFFGEPSAQLHVTGITGTNGKTSVSHFISQSLQRLETHCGVMGTLGYGAWQSPTPLVLTTPDNITVHRLLAELRDGGSTHVAMEVSSHALAQARVAGVSFDTAVFTNLSRDHLDYHGSMAEYASAKAQLFRQPIRHAVVNVDDPAGREIAARLSAEVTCIGYGLQRDRVPSLERVIDTYIYGNVSRLDTAGVELEVATSEGKRRLRAPVLGRFNAANLLAALGALLALDVELDRAVTAMSGVQPIPGRMQLLGGRSGEPLVVVDYSHTPDALAHALAAAREHCARQLWCVFGCGGDRDPGKRALMAEAAIAGADHIIVTDDNPRTEPGDKIVSDIMRAMPDTPALKSRVVVERDRGAAISLAVKAAAVEDIVVVAGKGHENYQEIDGMRHPFSDVAAVRTALEGIGR